MPRLYFFVNARITHQYTLEEFYLIGFYFLKRTKMTKQREEQKSK